MQYNIQSKLRLLNLLMPKFGLESVSNRRLSNYFDPNLSCESKSNLIEKFERDYK